MGFEERTYEAMGGPLRAKGVSTLQANIGYRCTLQCGHCHLEASPERTEEMDSATCEALIRVLEENPSIGTLDITGGAPELHPRLKRLVSSARTLGRHLHVIVRSNLSALLEPGMEGLPEFFASNQVEVAASFPHYERAAFERVRGAGSYDACVKAIGLLNAAGYGHPGGLALSLVHNPAGAYFAPSQTEMEAEYRRELGFAFTRLHVFANMPIGRFGQFLDRTGQRAAYQKKLEDAFNPCALDGVMCRTLVSVAPDGRLFDCDFNQATGLRSAGIGHISSFDSQRLAGREITGGEHCFGCVAGAGFT